MKCLNKLCTPVWSTNYIFNMIDLSYQVHGMQALLNPRQCQNDTSILVLNVTEGVMCFNLALQRLNYLPAWVTNAEITFTIITTQHNITQHNTTQFGIV